MSGSKISKIKLGIIDLNVNNILVFMKLVSHKVIKLKL